MARPVCKINHLLRVFEHIAGVAFMAGVAAGGRKTATERFSHVG